MARQRRQEQNPLDKNEQERKSLWFINLRLNFPLQKFHLFRHYHRSRVIMSSQGSLRCPGWLWTDWLSHGMTETGWMIIHFFQSQIWITKLESQQIFVLFGFGGVLRVLPSSVTVCCCFFFICPVKTFRSCLFLCVGMPREFIHPTVAP